MTSHPTPRGEGEMRLVLSWPPSTNALFANVPGKGRVTSKEYAAWQTLAGWELKAQRPPKFPGPVTILVELCSPHGSFDPDNRLKACLDLLVKHGVIKADDDSIVREVTARPVHGAVGACTVVVRDA